MFEKSITKYIAVDIGTMISIVIDDKPFLGKNNSFAKNRLLFIILVYTFKLYINIIFD